MKYSILNFEDLYFNICVCHIVMLYLALHCMYYSIENLSILDKDPFSQRIRVPITAELNVYIKIEQKGITFDHDFC